MNTQEELKGQLAEALPGAVGIFAEALYGKDPDGEAKLFKAMEKGQVKLEELVKVIDHMKTLSREDLIKKMLDSPAKKMEKMRTAWSRLLTEINSSFMLDTFTFVFDTMADGIRDITKWMKENKGAIDSWVKGIKIAGKALMELAPILLTIWGLRKVFGLFGMLTAGSRSLRNLRYLLLGGDIMRLLSGGSGGARLGTALLSMWRKALFILRLGIPLLIAGVADDIYAAMVGGESIIGRASQSDNPFAKWVSRAILGAFEVGKAIFVSGFALADLLFGSRDVDLYIGVLKENALALRDWMVTNFGELVPDSLVQAAQYIAMLFAKITGNFSTLIDSQRMLASGNVVGAFRSLSGLSTIGSIPSFSEYRESLVAKPTVMPVGTSPYSTNNPSFMLPRNGQGVGGNQTINLTINAEGTPDAIKSVATQAFADMMSSSILGVSANYQGGK